MSKSNEGQMGDESRRWAGKDISELDPRQRAAVQAQDTENAARKRRKAILDQFPPYKVDAMQAAVKQANTAIRRFQECIVKEQATITEFQAQIKLCEMRDKLLRDEGLDPR